jgi:hypothetical protein
MTSFSTFAKAGLALLSAFALVACDPEGPPQRDQPSIVTSVVKTDNGKVSSAMAIAMPWIRSAAPPVKTSAGYMVITNHGDQSDKLLSVSAPFSEISELHQSLTEDGVTMMRRIRELEIPAGATISLEPGGYHLMFINLTGALEEGEPVPVTLIFEKAGEVEIMMPVKAGKADAGHHGH